MVVSFSPFNDKAYNLKLVKSTFSDSHECPLYTGLEGRHGRDRMDLQLSMQSMPITGRVVISNPVHADVYAI